ncbi:hypothetical protein IE81DRAFT_201132 [Ceraceosorus guamensis]|uniref:Uncharacterized protein n=1 Tax=Ceraceosorus guamensis TaxID=1522189 RepID=A0A316VVD4_9BASI|nr:hypothetical protein IE81DRAFT_201132 [Ceraceosorus guamensis]PWN40898.1 hypothetical protein IE81DRAFT_201132 [Ceraceosorus guamensis]
MPSPLTSTPVRAHMTASKSLVRRSRLHNKDIREAYLQSDTSFDSSTKSDSDTGPSVDVSVPLPVLLGERCEALSHSTIDASKDSCASVSAELKAVQSELHQTRAALWVARQTSEGKSKELDVWRAAPKCRKSSFGQESSGEALIEKRLGPPQYKTRAKADEGHDRRARLEILKAKFAQTGSDSIQD